MVPVQWMTQEADPRKQCLISWQLGRHTQLTGTDRSVPLQSAYMAMPEILNLSEKKPVFAKNKLLKNRLKKTYDYFKFGERILCMFFN